MMTKKHLSPDELFTWFNEISIIAQLSGNLFERALPGDLTTSQFSALNWFVRVDSEATPARVATAFQVTRGAMTNTVNRLEWAGHVHIRPDWDDARRKFVSISPAGKKALNEAFSAVAPILNQTVEAIGSEKVRMALPVLREFRRRIEE